MNTHSVLLILILSLFFVSCEKEIRIDTTGYKKQLVVNSVFRVNEPIVIYFSYTSTTNKKYQHIDDTLHIKLYESNRLVYSGSILADSLQTNILPSNNGCYKICVKTAELDSVIAMDTIPRQVYITDATINRHASIGDYGEYTPVSFTFTDPANERNYYELSSSIPYESSVKITDPVLLNEGDIDYYPFTCFFSDELIDGKTYTMKIMVSGNYMKSIALRSVSRNYYLYRKYFTRHYYTQPASERDIYGLLHLAEPVSMFTNVQGGLGTFVGYSESEQFVIREVN